MSKLTAFSNLGRITDPAQFIQYASRVISDIQAILNGKIEFDANIASQTVTTYFPAANADLVIKHELNRTGLKFMVVDKTGPCDIYHNSKLDSVSQIDLKSSVAGVTVTLILF